MTPDRRIVEFEKGGEKRAEYGEALLQRLAQDLNAKFGRGFSYPNVVSPILSCVSLWEYSLDAVNRIY